MYVCMYVCMHACMHACIYLHSAMQFCMNMRKPRKVLKMLAAAYCNLEPGARLEFHVAWSGGGGGGLATSEPSAKSGGVGGVFRRF